MRVAPRPAMAAGGEPWLTDHERALKMTRLSGPTSSSGSVARRRLGRPSGAGVAQVRFPLGVLSLALAPGD